MALIFLGRLGPEKMYPITVKGKRVMKKMRRQQFAAGVMKFKDKQKGQEPVLKPRLGADKKQVMKDGKPMFDYLYDAKGQPMLKDVIHEVSIGLSPKDIGKKIKCGDEKYVYEQGPAYFKKA